MERKIYKKLKEWKERSKGTSALLIDGARRVGKSYIAQEFAKNEYKSIILIDFSYPNPEVIKCFEEDYYDLDAFFTKLSLIFRVALHKRESLVIFDEIQLYPRARQLIKHFVADGRYDYIETGSLISLRQNVKDILIPSEEEHIKMYPMDFEEFLLALGDTLTVPFLKENFLNRTQLGAAVHRKVLKDFRTYMLVGGMPQAVLKYVEGKNFEEVESIKKQILNLYRTDIGKFSGNEEEKVFLIFDNIVNELSKKEKKFKVSHLSKNARMRDFEDAFSWLDNSMMVNRCFNSTDPQVGLNINLDYRTHKCYMADTGLLVTQAFADSDFLDNKLYKSILFDKLNVNEGMLLENIVSQMLVANGRKLFFYSRKKDKDRKNNIEIDFLITKDRKVVPIEVKSSSYQKHTSLDKFITKFNSRLNEKYILYQKDIMVKDGVTHLPVYMAMFL